MRAVAQNVIHCYRPPRLPFVSTRRPSTSLPASETYIYHLVTLRARAHSCAGTLSRRKCVPQCVFGLQINNEANASLPPMMLPRKQTPQQATLWCIRYTRARAGEWESALREHARPFVVKRCSCELCSHFINLHLLQMTTAFHCMHHGESS